MQKKRESKFWKGGFLRNTCILKKEQFWWMRYNYELYYLFIRYSCHNKGCRNQMAWACHTINEAFTPK
jgi:hypothetical protein